MPSRKVVIPGIPPRRHSRRARVMQAHDCGHVLHGIGRSCYACAIHWYVTGLLVLGYISAGTADAAFRILEQAVLDGGGDLRDPRTGYLAQAAEPAAADTGATAPGRLLDLQTVPWVREILCLLEAVLVECSDEGINAVRKSGSCQTVIPRRCILLYVSPDGHWHLLLEKEGDRPGVPVSDAVFDAILHHVNAVLPQQVAALTAPEPPKKKNDNETASDEAIARFLQEQEQEDADWHVALAAAADAAAAAAAVC